MENYLLRLQNLNLCLGGGDPGIHHPTNTFGGRPYANILENNPLQNV